jgi:predicted nucleotidyltransferase
MGEKETSAADELTAAEHRENVVRLVFGGSVERFREFCRVLREAIPEDTSVILRGSAVTGERWKDGARFDADGPGTSDLDLTLVGDKAIGLFKLTGFFVPGVHSRPVSEDDPEIAPDLIPLRDKLMRMVGRPVNIQASREIVIQFRGDLIGQPYLVLIDKNDPACNSRS